VVINGRDEAKLAKAAEQLTAQGIAVEQAAFDVSDPKARTPAGRWGRVEELQGAVIFLASSASDFVNGQNLYVDGGVLATL